MPWQFDIPEATVQRLSTYLTILRRLEGQGMPTVASSDIAHLANVNAAQVRKDLSYFGDFGRRGLGYRVPELREHLQRILGLSEGRNVIVIGAGNLGSALVGYPGFEPRGFHVVGIFDSDPAKSGSKLYGHEIFPMDRLAELVPRIGAEIAIIAVPGPAAQSVANDLVAVGIACILNLAPVHVNIPAGVACRRVDMTGQLEVLSFCLSSFSSAPEGEQVQ